MITYEELKSANERIAKVDIKGKDYAMVNDRVKAFREICPGGSIITEILSHDKGVVTMKATVSDSEGHILGTGISQEKEGSTFINKTSYIENCETSAVGRALGFAGIGVDGSMASAEEVATAMLNQGGRKKEQAPEGITESQWHEIEDLVEVANVNKDALLKKYNIESFMLLTPAQYKALKEKLTKAIEAE